MSFARGALLRLACRQMSSSSIRLPLTERIKNKVNYAFREQPKMVEASVFLYEAAVDQINMPLWFKHFQLPDTFLSWFYVTELHVWMLLTRAMVDTDKGKFLRNQVIENLWRDSDARIKKLASVPFSIKRQCMNELSEHFNAMVCIYDEGLNKDDQALANALWRVILSSDPDLQDLTRLRTLVHYVRRNVAYLDDLPLEQFCAENYIKWKPLEESVKATTPL